MEQPDLNDFAPSILLIDDDPGTIQVIRKALKEYPDVRFATSGIEGLVLAAEAVPDLVLLDAEMPLLSGLETMRRIKADPQLHELPVVFVTSSFDTDLEIEALDLGAVDFITKPVNPALLRARVRTQLRLKHLTDQLRRMATRDGLTGLANRLQLDQRLKMEWARAIRQGEPLSVVMLDVDHFKRFNDAAGHLAGDEVLRQVAAVLQVKAYRSTDLAASYGGEEFTLLFPNTDAQAAMALANDVRRRLAELNLSHPDSPTGPCVTISAGVSTLDGAKHRGETQLARHGPEALIRQADAALYAAKRSGRNQVAFEVCEAVIDAPSP